LMGYSPVRRLSNQKSVAVEMDMRRIFDRSFQVLDLVLSSMPIY
jgi:hypothetical protein